MQYICNDRTFNNYDDVINYAEFYFQTTGIVLGIEYREDNGQF